METPDTHTLRLDTYFEYRTGQFIQVMIPNDKVIRSYSLSSSPTEKGFVSITVKAEPMGHLSNLLIKLQAGDILDVKGPFGVFSLPQPTTGPIIYLPAGSGVAPFRAMGKFLNDQNYADPQWMFYTAKTPVDLIFHKELESWAQRPTCHYIPTVTRPFEGPWSGERGRMDEAKFRKYLPNFEGTFLLCGPDAFVKAMIDLLSGPLQVPATRIRREIW